MILSLDNRGTVNGLWLIGLQVVEIMSTGLSGESILQTQKKELAFQGTRVEGLSFF